MRKKYRIKATINPDYVNPCYKVQVLRWFGWVDVKRRFYLQVQN